MEWKEDLSNLDTVCPPVDAQECDIWVYRLVDRLPSNDSDFYSYRKLYPSRKFQVSECQARACSVFEDIQDARTVKKIRKSNYIISVHVLKNDGVLLYTPSRTAKSHMSWWISRSFDIKNAEYTEVS